MRKTPPYTGFPLENNNDVVILAQEQAFSHSPLIIDWKSLCTQLLPKVKGWESIFVRQLLSQKHISCIQEEKLQRIATRHGFNAEMAGDRHITGIECGNSLASKIFRSESC
ncbi:MAG TPA: hypothetical protein DD990_15315 [Cyanobacteria bacterium UBA11368]|nr:hypothetical protein [Cyanobacteria bacterium UBA11368]